MDRKRTQILGRLRGQGAKQRAKGPHHAPAAGESFAFAAEIPGDSGAKPLFRLAVELQTQPQGAGERMRMRVHWQANFASALALAGPRVARIAANTAGPGNAIAERVGNWVRAGFSRPLVRRLAAPLLRHDFNSWMDLSASSAELDNAAQALLPQRERLQALGVQVPEGDGPLAQTWTGATPGPHPGFAQLSLLRLDKRHLPPAVAALLGAQPFQLAAAFVNVVEEQPPRHS